MLLKWVSISSFHREKRSSRNSNLLGDEVAHTFANKKRGGGGQEIQSMRLKKCSQKAQENTRLGIE